MPDDEVVEKEEETVIIEEEDEVIPVFVKRKPNHVPPSDAEVSYLLAANGVFLCKRLGIMEASIPVKSIPDLAVQTPYAKLHVKPMPLPLFAQIVNFFRWVLKEKHAEAIVILFYHPEKALWKLEAPIQTVSPGSIKYEDGMQIGEGWLRIGTIHSHCDMSPFHSGTDQADEAKWDGLHATLGYLSREHPGISVNVVANSSRFDVGPEVYFEGVSFQVQEIEETVQVQSPPSPRYIIPRRRRGMVNQISTALSKWMPSTVVGEDSGPKADEDDASGYEVVTQAPPPVTTYKRLVKREGLFFAFEEEESFEDYPFPEHWKEQVRTLPVPKPVVYQATKMYRSSGSSAQTAWMSSESKSGSPVPLRKLRAFHGPSGDFVVLGREETLRAIPMDVFEDLVKEKEPHLHGRISYDFDDRHRPPIVVSPTPINPEED